MAEYIKVKLEKGSDYDNLSIWKHKYDEPKNLVFQSMKFEINEDIKPGTYQLSVWKNDNRKSDTSPHGSISLVRIEWGNDDGETKSEGKETDFDF